VHVDARLELERATEEPSAPESRKSPRLQSHGRALGSRVTEEVVGGGCYPGRKKVDSWVSTFLTLWCCTGAPSGTLFQSSAGVHFSDATREGRKWTVGRPLF
jgi:hypothetical protein